MSIVFVFQLIWHFFSLYTCSGYCLKHLRVGISRIYRNINWCLVLIAKCGNVQELFFSKRSVTNFVSLMFLRAFLKEKQYDFENECCNELKMVQALSSPLVSQVWGTVSMSLSTLLSLWATACQTLPCLNSLL